MNERRIEPAIWPAMFAIQTGLCIVAIGVLLHVPAIVVGGAMISAVLVFSLLLQTLARNDEQDLSAPARILTVTVGILTTLATIVIAGLLTLYVFISYLFNGATWNQRDPRQSIFISIAVLLVIGGSCSVATVIASTQPRTDGLGEDTGSAKGQPTA